jgi:hypothetical protein
MHFQFVDFRILVLTALEFLDASAVSGQLSLPSNDLSFHVLPLRMFSVGPISSRSPNSEPVTNYYSGLE